MTSLIRATLLPTIVAVVAAVTVPGLQRVVVSLWALYVTACGLFFLSSYVGSLVKSSRFEAALATDPKPRTRPEDLVRLEHSLGWRAYSPRDFDYEVRPLLSELIVHRARSRRGIELLPDTRAGAGVIDEELIDLASGKSVEELYGGTVNTNDISRCLSKIEQL
jgi:hypothetical protein